MKKTLLIATFFIVMFSVTGCAHVPEKNVSEDTKDLSSDSSIDWDISDSYIPHIQEALLKEPTLEKLDGHHIELSKKRTLILDGTDTEINIDVNKKISESILATRHGTYLGIVSDGKLMLEVYFLGMKIQSYPTILECDNDVKICPLALESNRLLVSAGSVLGVYDFDYYYFEIITENAVAYTLLQKLYFLDDNYKEYVCDWSVDSTSKRSYH